MPSQPRAPTLLSADDDEMTLQFYRPDDIGGAQITKYELYINDGDDSHDPTTLVSTYTSNALTHTLKRVDDALTIGKIYKVLFRAYNSIGNSVDSPIARYALVDSPAAPG